MSSSSEGLRSFIDGQSLRDSQDARVFEHRLQSACSRIPKRGTCWAFYYTAIIEDQEYS